MRQPDYSLHQAYLIGGLVQDVAHLKESHAAMRKDLDLVLAWGRRLVILGLLYGAAIGSHLSRDQASDLLAQTLSKAAHALLKM